MPGSEKTFSEDELVSAIHKAAKEFGLKEKLDNISQRQDATFMLLGVDPDSVDDVKSFRSTMLFAESLQKISTKVGATIIVTIASVATIGIVTLVVKSFRGEQ